MAKIKTNEINYNTENYIAMANNIIKGKQFMSLQTAKLIRLIITQIGINDKELKIYNCKITELANLLNVKSNNIYRDIRNICETTMKSIIYIGTGNPKEPWKIIHWVSNANYDGQGNIKIELSKEIKPYVIELNKWFTKYKLKNILEFNSYYAIRIYEIIMCKNGEQGKHKNKIEIELNELRQMLDCESKYKLFADFKRKAIEPARKEINQKSDIVINNITYIKTGKAVTSIIFEISPKKDLTENKTEKKSITNTKQNKKTTYTNNKENTSYDINAFDKYDIFE